MNMQTYKVFTLLLFLLSQFVFSQTDSTNVVYSTDSITELEYNTNRSYKYFDRSQQEEKLMLRFGLTNSFSPSEAGYITSVFDFAYIDFEKKLGNSSSLILGLSHVGSGSSSESTFSPTVALGYNYFYKASNQIKNGESANNLIGPYFSIQYRYVFNKHVDSYLLKYYGNAVRLVWGAQHRFWKFGYMGINTGFQYAPSNFEYVNTTYQDGVVDNIGDKISTHYSLFAELKLGLAFGNLSPNAFHKLPYSTNIRNKKDHLLRRMEDDKTFVKLGGSGFTINENRLSINGEFVIEQKLMPSFSIILINSFSLGSDFNSNYSRYHPYLGVRYYHNMKRNIERRESGNNFSSGYFAMNVRDYINIIDGKLENNTPEYQPKIELLYGLQRKVGKIGYFDIGAGGFITEKEAIGPILRLTIGVGY